MIDCSYYALLYGDYWLNWLWDNCDFWCLLVFEMFDEYWIFAIIIEERVFEAHIFLTTCKFIFFLAVKFDKIYNLIHML